MNDDKWREHCRAVTRALLDINSAKSAWRDLMDAMFLDMAYSADSMEKLLDIISLRQEMVEFAKGIGSELNREQRLMRGMGWWDDGASDSGRK